MKFPSIRDIFLPPSKDKEFNFQRYIADLEDEKFRNVWNLGVSEEKKWLLKNFAVEPNAAFIGAMGSGKSVAANFTILTWLLANSDQTIVFIADTLKGANDYQALFKCDQVFPVLNSEGGIHRVIDLMYDEAMARREAFNEVQAENLYEYEKKMRNITGNENFKIARCVLLIEEFHSVPYNILNFDKDFKIPNTSAFKFHQLMRIGRSMGTWVIACSQKGTKSDIPSEIIPNFTQKQIFRVNRNEASYFLSDTKAAEIRTDQKGRCETDFGTVQFPYIPIDTQKILLQKYLKPLEAEACYLTPQLIRDYLNGHSTEELYKLKKLPDLIEGIESYDHELIVAMMHRRLEHKVTQVDSKIDPNGISLIVEWPGKGRIAVMIRVGTKKITGKHIHKLSKGMRLMNCDRGILYTSAEDLPAGVYKNAVEHKIELVDHEDMLRLARQIEAKMQALKDLDPSKLADEEKESGEYQKTHHPENETEDLSSYDSLDEHEDNKPTYIKEIPENNPATPKDEDEEDSLAKKALQELLEENKETDKSPEVEPTSAKESSPLVEPGKAPDVADEENVEEKLENFSEENSETEQVKKELELTAESTLIAPLNAAIKPVKRVPVRGSFYLKSDESPEILLHALRNASGDVYRVLMYVIINKNTHHKYFLDRQVQGEFDVKDRAKLSVVNTAEWNTQKDEVNNRMVLASDEFEKELLAYLDNFKQYELGMVKAICWQEDADFFRPILAKCRHMDPNPTIFEDMAQVYGIEGSREVLLAQNKLSIKRQDIFTPVEVDLQIWKYLSP